MGSDLRYKTPCELQAFSLLKHSSHILKWIRVRRMSFCPKPRSRSRMSAPLVDSQNNSGSPLCRIYPETLDRYRHVCFWWFSCLLHRKNSATNETWLYEIDDCVFWSASTSSKLISSFPMVLRRFNNVSDDDMREIRETDRPKKLMKSGMLKNWGSWKHQKRLRNIT